VIEGFVMIKNSEQYAANKLSNMFQTFIIVFGMAALFGALGWMMFGKIGLVWALVLVFVLSLTTPRISPHMVLRMYGARKLTYSEVHGLYNIISKLSRKAGLTSVPQIYYVPSKVMNAFSVGVRENSAIAVSDGIIRHLNRREISGVLAHEVGHIANNDLRLHALADIMTRITSTLSFFGQILILFYLPLALFSQTHISLVLILLLIFAPTLSMMLQLALSRTREFNADLTAARLSGDPMGLASALKKMDTYERSIWDIIFLPGRKVPQPSLLRTHPHTKERVEKLMRLAQDESMTFSHSVDRNILLPENYPVIDRNPRYHWYKPWY
jgi:heat shock protein HtpX